MKTAQEFPEIPFQNEGQVCPSCKPMWDFDDLPPKKMIAVRNAQGEVITTRNHMIPLVVCPYCDGDLVLRLARTHETNINGAS